MNRKHETCTVPGCTRPHKSKGYCRAHYIRFWRGKPVDSPVRGGEVPRCSVDGCTDEAHGRGLCLAHYARQRRGAPIAAEIKRRDRNQPEHCVEPGCTNPVKSKGLCKMHYARHLRHGSTGERSRQKPQNPCTVTGCDGAASSNGLCERHYQRFRKAAKFGATPEDIARLFKEQDGKCAICRCEEESPDGTTGRTRELAMDHNHSTGKLRGLLCGACNKAIGMLGDDPAVLRAAITYLEKHAA